LLSKQFSAAPTTVWGHDTKKRRIRGEDQLSCLVPLRNASCFLIILLNLYTLEQAMALSLFDISFILCTTGSLGVLQA
jgi:hypothetical protein